MPTQREIVFPRPMYEEMLQYLLHDPHTEQLAFVLAAPNRLPGVLKLLACELIPVQADGFSEQSGGFLSVRDDVSRAILARCADEGKSLIEVHSHPFCRGDVVFSATDIANEGEKFPYVAQNIPRVYHATVVVGQGSLDAHMWDRRTGAVVGINRVRIAGAPLASIIPTSAARAAQRTGKDRAAPPAHAFDRQVLAFGEEGQRRLRDCYVGIVGVGGAGSAVVQMLSHLGVGRLLLVDPDVVEETNLNRLIGATPADARRASTKVTVMRRLARRINPALNVTAVAQRLDDTEALAALKGVDVLFGCTDDHGSRLALNRLAVQYLIPYIDVGAGIRADAGGCIVEAGGQVRLVLPGGFCLECIGGIDREQAGRDLLSRDEQEQRRARGYVDGAEVAAPAVVSLNSTVASLAVSEFMALVTGCKPVAGLIFYDLLHNALHAAGATKRADCVCCGDPDLPARGDLEPLHSLRAANLPASIPGAASKEAGNDGTAHSSE